MNCLKKVKELQACTITNYWTDSTLICRKQPHLDNKVLFYPTSAHTFAFPTTIWAKLGVELHPYPPYSLELVLFKSSVFANLKISLARQKLLE